MSWEMEHSYAEMRRVSYDGGAVFVPVCERCKRFVKADPTIMVNDATGLSKQPNATCTRCGRVQMLFEGFL